MCGGLLSSLVVTPTLSWERVSMPCPSTPTHDTSSPNLGAQVVGEREGEREEGEEEGEKEGEGEQRGEREE